MPNPFLSLLAEPVVTTFLRAFLTLLFSITALSKLRHAEEFFGVVRNFRLLPGPAVRPFAVALPWLELGLAAGLVIPAAAPFAAATASALLALFGVAIGVNVARGRTAIDCGCFRNAMRQTLSWLLVVRNAVLALAAGALAAILPTAPGPAVLDLAVGLAAAGLATLLGYGASLLSGLPAATRSHSSPKG